MPPGTRVLGIFAPDNRFTRNYQRSDLDAAGEPTLTVDWVSGACFLVRREAFEEVGGFDESYFMYAEDVDLCWRLGRAGWRVAYAPSAEVTHLQGRSTDRHPYRMILEHHRSLLRFASRSSEGWRRALLPLVAVGIAVRVAWPAWPGSCSADPRLPVGPGAVVGTPGGRGCRERAVGRWRTVRDSPGRGPGPATGTTGRTL